MKLLYFGDLHARKTTPENRTDDFLATQRAKIAEIREIGKKNKVQAFLQPGDFFDKENPGNAFVSEIANLWDGNKAHDLLSDFRAGKLQIDEVLQSMNDYIPMVGVAGNHELYGNSIHTLDKTAIGSFNKSGQMRFATKENPYYFYTPDGLTVAVTGTHYHLNIDKAEHINDYIVEEKRGDFHIHIVHGYLANKNMGKFIRHTLIDQITHTKADLTITGHDHIGFPLTEIDGKYFVNPGAVMRTKNDVKEMKRKPKILLIDITKEKGMQIEEKYLKTAQSGELVLNRQKIEERKERDSRLGEFKKAIKDVGMEKSTDIMQIISDLADSKVIPKELKEDVLNRVSDKKAEMSDINDEQPIKAHAVKFILENFQAHAYTELDLADGFNIFVGDSGRGKTSVLRAFSWVYENKPSGKNMIRRGTDYARAILVLSNGVTITRLIEAKKSGKNGYEIYDPTTGVTEYHNTKILPEIQKLLGFKQLVIDNDQQFNLNFMKQGTGWFLIGDNYPAPQKAKILGSIYGVQFADSVMREFDLEEGQITKSIRSVGTEVNALNEQVKEFSYLDQLESSIKEYEELFERIQLLEEKKLRLSHLVTKVKEQKAQLVENDEILSNLKDLSNWKDEQAKLQDAYNRFVQLEEKRISHQKLTNGYKAILETIERTSELQRAKNGEVYVSGLINKRENVRKLREQHEFMTQQLKVESDVLESTKGIHLWATDLHKLKQLSEERQRTSERMALAKKLEVEKEEAEKRLVSIQRAIAGTEEINEMKAVYTSIQEFIRKQTNVYAINVRQVDAQRLKSSVEVEIQQFETDKEKALGRYVELLKEQGTCPTCYAGIDRQTIERIEKNLANKKPEAIGAN